MSWGDALVSAYDAASNAARQAAAVIVSSAAAGADAVRRAEAAAREAATSALKAGANVASFGARAAGNTAVIAGRSVAAVAGAPYRGARQLLAPLSTPTQTVVGLCPNTWADKKARLEKRRQLIRDGQRSPEPAVRAAADRFAQNNEAVELARLSNDSYARYPAKEPAAKPPLGWSVMSNDELEAKGISSDRMDKARAVMYQTPEDWPGGKQTVLAFRGTADLEDGIVDHDQALALETRQYRAAAKLGQDVRKGFGENVLVTGHSLGGGKAQAAGATGGLSGMMFNSAGLHPEAVNGKMPSPSQFTQYRTTGDPLTGTQKSPAIQAAMVSILGPLAGAFGGGMKVGDMLNKALGGSGLAPDAADYADKAFKALPRSLRNIVQSGNALPPAIGPVHEVLAIDKVGAEISGANLAGQHSILSVINGIEKEKDQDMAVLAAH